MPIKTDKESSLKYGRALYDIQALLSGIEWDAGTTDQIAKVMREAGFHIYGANEYPRWASTSSGRIELYMSLEEAQSAAHQGRCDDDVRALSELPHIAAQLAEIDPALLARELKEYGAWDDEQLADHGQNLQRLLWSLANDIADGEPDESE